MVEFAIDILTEICKITVPVAAVFGFGNIIVSSVLRAAFGGKLWFGR